MACQRESSCGRIVSSFGIGISTFFADHSTRIIRPATNHLMTEMRKPILRALADGLIRLRFVLLLLGIVALIAAFPVARRLQFDQSIESLYADDDPHIRDYLESKSLFGGDEFVIVAYRDDNLFEAGSLETSPELQLESRQRIEELAAKLNAIDGVWDERTQHLAAMLRLTAKRKSIIRMSDRMLVGDDRQSTAIVLRLENESQVSGEPGESFDELRGKTFAEILKIADEHDRPTYVVGEPLQIHYMFRYVQEDGRLLFFVSLGLLGCVLLLFFARPHVAHMVVAMRFGVRAFGRQLATFLVQVLQWVGLPLLVVVATILWTEAVLVLSGAKLSMVSSMLNSMVTIIGIATVTHVTVHYREHRRNHNRVDAFRHSFVELLPAIYWTCLTTAIGFAALLYSSITPVSSFGLMMALASGLVLMAVIVILPGGILIGRWSTDPLNAPGEAGLVRFLMKLIDWVERRPLLLAGIAAVSVAFTAAGLFRLEVETDFSKNFRKSSPLVQGLNFVETELGGAGTWEVNFPAPKKLNEEYLTRVRKLADDLRSLNAGRKNAPHLTKVISLTDGLDLVPKEVRLPIFGTQKLSIPRRLTLLKIMQEDFESSLYHPQRGRMRIVLRAREQQSAQDKLSLIAETERLARETFPQAKTTGLFVLLAFMIESLLSDQLVSFALAAVGIALMMTLAFRSLKLGLISLVPNFFPIVLVIGTMGWSGLPINIATAMIASVSMGLTVDSTIHYISAFQRARRNGLTVGESLRDCHRGVGRALVFANVALIVGFAVLSLSHFIPLVYFGLLLSVAMVGGLIGDLVLLPLLLQWAVRHEAD